MNRAGLLVCILIHCSTLNATPEGGDFWFSWECDWGWVSNFRDEYSVSFNDSILTIHADDARGINTLEVELGLEYSGISQTVVIPSAISMVTDFGAYAGTGDFEILCLNGYTDSQGRDYADFGIVGYGGVGLGMADLNRDWQTRFILCYERIWGAVASSWNLTVNDSLSERQIQVFAGLEELYPGMLIEAGIRLNPDRGGTTFVLDGVYRWAGFSADIDAVIGGSFAWTNLDGSNFTDIYGMYVPVLSAIFGLGLEIRVNMRNSTVLYSSVSYKGDELESLRAIGWGFGITRGQWGCEAATSYDLTLSAGDPSFEGFDISGGVQIGAVHFSGGYVFTDGYGWSNGSTGNMTAIGGMYMNFSTAF